MQTCILVLGMHRSGTSALTRIINMLGGQLPKHLLGAQLGNDAGHWEPFKLLLLHDELLAAAGSRWDDIRPLDLGRLSPDLLAVFKKRMQNLVREEYGDAPVFVVKDPRICRFAPFFVDTLAELGIDVRVALTLRNPLSVAQSIQKRNGYSLDLALLLWLRHQLDAEASSRALEPFHIQFEELMADPDNWVSRLRTWMEGGGITSTHSDAEIINTLHADLMHFRHKEDDVLQVAEPVREAFEASLLLGDVGRRAEAQLRLDAVRRSFDPSSIIFGAVLLEELAARRRLWEEEARQRERALGSEIDAVREQSRRTEAEIDGERTKAHRLEAELHAMRSSTSWRMTAPLRQLRLALSGLKHKSVVAPAPEQPRFEKPTCLIATTAHALFTAELLARQLRDAGYDSVLVRDRVGDTSGYAHVFAVCPQNFSDLPDGYIAMQMEQHVAARWFTPSYLALLSRASMVLDYSRENIDHLKSLGLPVEKLVFLPLDANPALLPANIPDKTIDVLFYGNENSPRRKRLLDALRSRFKIDIVNDLFDEDMRQTIQRARVVLNIHFYDTGLLETNRVFEALSLGVPVVSEIGSDQNEHTALSEVVDFAALDDTAAMTGAIERLLNDPGFYADRMETIRRFALRSDNAFATHFTKGVLPSLAR